MVTNDPRDKLTDGEKDWGTVARLINKVSQYVFVVTALLLAGAFLFVYLGMPGGRVYIGDSVNSFAVVSFGEAMKTAASKFEAAEVFKALGRRMMSGKKDLIIFVFEALKRKLGRLFGM